MLRCESLDNQPLTRGLGQTHGSDKRSWLWYFHELHGASMGLLIGALAEAVRYDSPYPLFPAVSQLIRFSSHSQACRTRSKASVKPWISGCFRCRMFRPLRVLILISPQHPIVALGSKCPRALIHPHARALAGIAPRCKLPQHSIAGSGPGRAKPRIASA